MRWTLMHKYVGSLFGALITCCGVVLFVSIYFMKTPIENELDKGIQRMCQVVHMSNESTAQRFAQSAALMADEDSLARAIAEKDHETAYRLGQTAMKKAKSDFMTITDAEGVVVARGHATKYGDSVLKQETVAKALKGEPAVAVVAGTVVPFTIRASQPVMYEGRLVGSISIGVSLVGPAYMDWLGKVTGSHVTIFKGDTRVMTTIVRDGKRVIGTRLESKDIVKAVLERGETVYAHNSILGVPYNSAYWPVKAADGKTVGMWFVGMPIDVLRSLEKTAIQKAIMVGCALLVLQLAISVVLGRMVGAPVAKITRYAQDVAEGKGDLHLDVHSRDDMGLLADSLRSMEANLRKLVAEAAAQAEAARRKGTEAEQAMAEAKRCLECGCHDYHECSLIRYARGPRGSSQGRKRPARGHDQRRRPDRRGGGAAQRFHQRYGHQGGKYRQGLGPRRRAFVRNRHGYGRNELHRAGGGQECRRRGGYFQRGQKQGRNRRHSGFQGRVQHSGSAAAIPGPQGGHD